MQQVPVPSSPGKRLRAPPSLAAGRAASIHHIELEDRSVVINSNEQLLSGGETNSRPASNLLHRRNSDPLHLSKPSLTENANIPPRIVIEQNFDISEKSTSPAVSPSSNTNEVEGITSGDNSTSDDTETNNFEFTGDNKRDNYGSTHSGLSRLTYPFRTLVLLVLGCTALLMPIWLLEIIPSYQLGSWLTVPASQWSFAACSIWGSFFLIDAILRLVQYITAKSVALSDRDIIEYLDKIRSPLFQCLFTGTTLGLWDTLIVSYVDQSQCSTGLSLDTVTDPCSQLTTVRRIIVCAVITTTLIVLEKALLQRVAWVFHRTALKPRMIQNRFACYAIDHLMRAYSKRRNSSTKTFGSMYLHSANTSQTLNAATNTPHALLDFSRFKKGFHLFKSKVERHAKKPHAKVTAEARRTAEQLFQLLSVSDRPYLLMDDFAPYFKNPVATRDVFSLFDTNHDGTVQPQEFFLNVINIFKEKHALSKTVADTDSAMASVDHIFLALVLFLSALAWMAVFEVNLQAVLPLTLSSIVALNMAIGQTARNLTESVVFILFVHAYDVGDRIQFDNTTYTVQQINLLTTLFVRWDGYVVYVPNSVLANKNITNLRRSTESKWYKVEVDVSPSTSRDQIEQLRNRLSDFITSRSSDYRGKLDFVVIDTIGWERLRFAVQVQHYATTDQFRSWTRHANFVAKVRQTLSELNILVLPPAKS